MAPSRNVVAIIDDDPGMRQALENMLSAFGYRTEIYASAEEFVRAAITTEAALPRCRYPAWRHFGR